MCLFKLFIYLESRNILTHVNFHLLVFCFLYFFYTYIKIILESFELGFDVPFKKNKDTQLFYCHLLKRLYFSTSLQCFLCLIVGVHICMVSFVYVSMILLTYFSVLGTIKYYVKYFNFILKFCIRVTSPATLFFLKGILAKFGISFDKWNNLVKWFLKF